MNAGIEVTLNDEERAVAEKIARARWQWDRGEAITDTFEPPDIDDESLAAVRAAGLVEPAIAMRQDNGAYMVVGVDATYLVANGQVTYRITSSPNEEA